MIVILGANGGIGRGLLAAAKQNGSEALGVYRADCDIESEASVESFMAGLSYPCHIVNATGHLINGMVHRAEMDDVDKTVSVNLRGSYLIAKWFRAYAKSGSTLTLLSSVVGRLGVPGAAAYGMCKAGIHGLVRSAAKECAHIGARVNAIEMGYFDVGMIDRIPEDKRSEIEASIPVGRFGTVQELWRLCRAVIENPYMTGQVVGITGGL